MKRNENPAAYAAHTSAQSYLRNDSETGTVSASCGSSCGSGGKIRQAQPKHGPCGSSCGSGGK